MATRGGELAGAWEGTKAYLAFLSEARCEHGNTVMEELTEGGRVEEGWKACRCEGGYGGCIRRRSARGAGKTPAVGGSLVAEAGRARKGKRGLGLGVQTSPRLPPLRLPWPIALPCASLLERSHELLTVSYTGCGAVGWPIPISP